MLNIRNKIHNTYFQSKELTWSYGGGLHVGYYQDPDNNLVEIFFEHFDTPAEFKNNISPDFEDEPIGTNMDIETLHEMYKSGTPFEKLIEKGNTVPEGKKPISGIEAVKNMKKKFKD